MLTYATAFSGLPFTHALTTGRELGYRGTVGNVVDKNTDCIGAVRKLSGLLIELRLMKGQIKSKLLVMPFEEDFVVGLGTEEG